MRRDARASHRAGRQHVQRPVLRVAADGPRLSRVGDLHALVDAGEVEPCVLSRGEVHELISFFETQPTAPGPVIGLLELVDLALEAGVAQRRHGVIELDSVQLDRWTAGGGVTVGDATRELLEDPTIPLPSMIHYRWVLDADLVEYLLEDNDLDSYSGSYNGRSFVHPISGS